MGKFERGDEFSNINWKGDRVEEFIVRQAQSDKECYRCHETIEAGDLYADAKWYETQLDLKCAERNKI